MRSVIYFLEPVKQYNGIQIRKNKQTKNDSNVDVQLLTGAEIDKELSDELNMCFILKQNAPLFHQ